LRILNSGDSVVNVRAVKPANYVDLPTPTNRRRPNREVRRQIQSSLIAERPSQTLTAILKMRLTKERTIGAVVATATGDERAHIRHALLGADVTVIDGQTPARFGAGTMKDVAGYETKRLHIEVAELLDHAINVE
jgi:hypothetical protein